MNISSEPPGAAVVVDGRVRGTTPLSLALRQGAPLRLEVSRAGYTAETRLVRPQPGLRIHVTLQPLPRPSLQDLKESPY